jgi:four helix bundle protein
MENKEFAKQLEDRTKKLAINIIRLSALLPDTTEARVIRRQITSSGTSIGAKYREANRARSKADFTSRTGICESEASETIYWLEIIDEMQWISKQIMNPVIKESTEILAIFASIGKTLKL